jgi:hypothetical protein
MAKLALVFASKPGWPRPPRYQALMVHKSRPDSVQLKRIRYQGFQPEAARWQALPSLERVNNTPNFAFYPQQKHLAPAAAFAGLGITTKERPKVRQFLNTLHQRLPANNPLLAVDDQGAVIVAGRWRFQPASYHADAQNRSVRLLTLAQSFQGDPIQVLSVEDIACWPVHATRDLHQQLLAHISQAEQEGSLERAKVFVNQGPSELNALTVDEKQPRFKRLRRFMGNKTFVVQARGALLSDVERVPKTAQQAETAT